jgi:hypothetical protein
MDYSKSLARAFWYEIQSTCDKTFMNTRMIYKIRGLKEKEVEN